MKLVTDKTKVLVVTDDIASLDVLFLDKFDLNFDILSSHGVWESLVLGVEDFFDVKVFLRWK